MSQPDVTEAAERFALSPFCLAMKTSRYSQNPGRHRH